MVLLGVGCGGALSTTPSLSASGCVRLLTTLRRLGVARVMEVTAGQRAPRPMAAVCVAGEVMSKVIDIATVCGLAYAIFVLLAALAVWASERR
jgi:hypothetical protein